MSHFVPTSGSKYTNNTIVSVITSLKLSLYSNYVFEIKVNKAQNLKMLLLKNVYLCLITWVVYSPIISYRTLLIRKCSFEDTGTLIILKVQKSPWKRLYVEEKKTVVGNLVCSIFHVMCFCARKPNMAVSAIFHKGQKNYLQKDKHIPSVEHVRKRWTNHKAWG